MPKTTRVSVTIDRALWDQFQQVTDGKLKASALFAEAVQDEINRLGMLALVEEWDREEPPTLEQRAKAARKWVELSSWIPERFRIALEEELHCADRPASEALPAQS